MIKIIKIFHFEMAHAINGYDGPCRHIHGHSYELHVSVASGERGEDYIPAPGFTIDFKELKRIVHTAVVNTLDHKLVLSRNYISHISSPAAQENLLIWDVEPTAENILVYAKKNIQQELPAGITLTALKLSETKDSYAEWANDLY